MGNKDKSEVGLYACKIDSNQIFVLTKQNEIRNFDLCLDTDTKNGTVKTLTCHNSGGNQNWVYDKQVSLIENFFVS